MGQSNSINNSVIYNSSNLKFSDIITIGLLCERNFYDEYYYRPKYKLDAIKEFIVESFTDKKYNNRNIIWETIDTQNCNIQVTPQKKSNVPIELQNKYDLVFGLGCPLGIEEFESMCKFVYTILKPNGIFGFITGKDRVLKPELIEYKDENDMTTIKNIMQDILKEFRKLPNYDNNFKNLFSNPKYFTHRMKFANEDSTITIFKKKNIINGGKKVKKVVKKKISKN